MQNVITVMGRLTANPVLRYTKNGTPVCTFTVACERDMKDTNGNRKTDFIDCVTWRSTGEFISQYFEKGVMISVNGRLEIREWVDNNNNKRRNAEVLVGNAYFCGNKAKTGEDETGTDVETESYNGAWEDLPNDGQLPF